MKSMTMVKYLLPQLEDIYRKRLSKFPTGQAEKQIFPYMSLLLPLSLPKGHWRLFTRVHDIFLGDMMAVKEAEILSYRIGFATKRLKIVGKINFAVSGKF